MRRRTLAVGLTAALGAGALGAAAPVHAASLSLRPAIAPAGASVSAQGAGWRPGSTVTIRRRGGAVLGRGLVAGDGTLAASLRVPRAFSVRTHPIQARGRGPGQAVDASLRVVAVTRDWAPREIATSAGLKVVISRTVAFPGAPVRIDASGLPANAFALAQLHDGAPVLGHADRRGRVTLSLTVPQTRLEGSTLRLRLGRTQRIESFYVVPPDTSVAPLPPPTRPDPVLAAAGDIACDPSNVVTPTACHQGNTSNLLVSAQPDAVAAVGDLQYDNGSPDEWSSYDLSWGRLRARTRPALGNHEYGTPGAAGYFQYWGSGAAGAPARGYYSYDLGAWHVIVLNSNCAIVSCIEESSQVRWLHADLAAHPDRCTLAYWHHPRHSSAQQTSENLSVQPFWQALADGGADLVLTGHVHNYERIAPLDANGNIDRAHGIRSFVVGTGGVNHGGLHTLKPYSERSSDDTFGVLFLSLGPTGYGWAFQPEVGAGFVDTGSAACH